MIGRLLQRHQAVVVLGLLCVVHLVGTLLVLWRDLPIDFALPDSFDFITNLFQLRTGLELGGLEAAARFMRVPNSHYSYLSMYVPTVASLPFDRVLLAARAANVVYFLILIYSVYRIGQRCHGRGAGLLAAVLVSLMPAVHGGWRTVGVDFPALCVTPLAFLWLIRSEGFCRLGASVIFGLTAGAAILIKAQCCFFLVPPAAYVLGRALLRARAAGRAKSLRPVLLGGGASVAVVLLVTAVWWLDRLGPILYQIQSHSTGEGMVYHEGDISLLGGVIHYAQAFSPLITGPLSLALVALAVPFFRNSRLRWEILLWIVVPLVLHVVLKVRHFRYLYPLAPALALVLGVGLWSLAPRVRRVATLATVLVAATLWIICPLSSLRCRREAPGPVTAYHELVKSDAWNLLLGCGDPIFVATACLPTAGGHVFDVARPMVRWIQEQRRRPEVLIYFTHGELAHAIAIQRLLPQARLSRYDHSGIPYYLPPAGWDSFVIMPMHTEAAALRRMSRRSVVGLFRGILGSSDGATRQHLFGLLKLSPDDPWYPATPYPFLTRLAR